MSNPNINLSNLDARYSKPADVATAISTQATTDAGQYAQISQLAPLAQAGQIPSQNPVAAGTSSVGTLAEAARADHVHPSAGLYTMYGSGADGTASFDGTTVPAGTTKDSSTVYRAQRDLYYSAATFSSGITLNMAGFQLYVHGVLSGPGTGSHAGVTCLTAAPSGANNGTAGAFTPGGANSVLPGRVASLGVGVRGPSGVVGVGVIPSAPTNWNNFTATYAAPGGAGGSGSSGSGGAATSGASGNANGGAAYTWRRPDVCLTGRVTYLDAALPGNSVTGLVMGGQAGSSGAGDGTNVGGAGGNGGQVIIVNAMFVAGLVDFTCAGNAGGSPTTGNCGGGGGGAGGVVYVNSIDLTAWTGAATAPGGAGGTGSGTGTAGGTGSSGSTMVSTWT